MTRTRSRDIHSYLETLDAEGVWRPTYARRPAHYWAEEIIEDRLDSDAALLIFGPPTEAEIEQEVHTRSEFRLVERDPVRAVLGEKLARYFRNMDDDEIIEKYSQESSFAWDYLPYGCMLGIKDRRWFTHVVELGEKWKLFDKDNTLGPIALAKRYGVSPEIASDIALWGQDGHSHGHVMVDRLLGITGGYHQVDWLKRAVDKGLDAANTRLIFFFDN